MIWTLCLPVQLQVMLRYLHCVSEYAQELSEITFHFRQGHEVIVVFRVM